MVGHIPPVDIQKNIIRHGILFSVDLLVRNTKGDLLVGLRTHEPAKHTWFVPGGRQLKGETVQELLSRVCKAELGLAITMEDVGVVGLFNHFYNTNTFEESDYGQQYTCLACEITFPVSFDELVCDEQHSDLQFMSPNDILARDDVHVHTKLYAQTPEMRAQNKICVFDNLLKQR